MKEKSGEDLIALASTLSIKLSCDSDLGELSALIEFLGLLRHNLEIIKCRRLVNKIKNKSDSDDDD